MSQKSDDLSLVVSKSVETDLIPEHPPHIRADLKISGWLLVPKGKNYTIFNTTKRTSIKISFSTFS